MGPVWLGVSHKVALISRLDWEGSTSSLSHMVVGGIQFLMGCWTEALVPHKPLAGGLGSLPYGSPHRASTIWWIALPE